MAQAILDFRIRIWLKYGYKCLSAFSQILYFGLDISTDFYASASENVYGLNGGMRLMLLNFPFSFQFASALKEARCLRFLFKTTFLRLYLEPLLCFNQQPVLVQETISCLYLIRIFIAKYWTLNCWTKHTSFAEELPFYSSQFHNFLFSMFRLQFSYHGLNRYRKKWKSEQNLTLNNVLEAHTLNSNL